MNKLSTLLLVLATALVAGCSSADSFAEVVQGEWRCTNVEGDHGTINVGADTFVLGDSDGEHVPGQWSRRGRTLTLTFPLQDESLQLSPAPASIRDGDSFDLRASVNGEALEWSATVSRTGNMLLVTVDGEPVASCSK